jgi:hypothetical protein
MAENSKANRPLPTGARPVCIFSTFRHPAYAAARPGFMEEEPALYERLAHRHGLGISSIGYKPSEYAGENSW